MTPPLPPRPLSTQFPGLSEADRLLLERQTGATETLVQLVERLHGTVADLTRQRPLTPALVLPEGPTAPWPQEQAAPLTVDASGFLRTRQRLVVTKLQLVVPQGKTLGTPLPLTLPPESYAAGAILFDAVGRPLAEQATFMGSLDGGANYWQLAVTSGGNFTFGPPLGASINVVDLGLRVAPCTHLLMKLSSAALGARTFTLFAFGA